MDLASIGTALIGGLAGASPVVYLALLVMLGMGFGWLQEHKAATADRAAASTRFDAMVKDKDDRFDTMVKDTGAALHEAQELASSINTEWTAANKDNSESIIKITEALQRVAETLATMPARSN